MHEGIRFPEKLLAALRDLDQWANQEALNIEIIVVGAFALHLLGVHSRATNDIDIITELQDERFLNVISEIASRHGLNPNWLNDQACGLSLPDGFHTRLSSVQIGSHIIARVPSRQDMISLKAAAFMIRGENDPKDFSDLIALKPTKKEIDEAILFVRKTQTPPQARFYPDFEEILARLYDAIR